MLRDKLFHHFEIALCGYSGSGKTTLITKMIEQLSNKYTIGYVKHDAHNFEMDKPGKDTYKASKAGARAIYICDENKMALLGDNALKTQLNKLLLLDMDFVLVEGYKDSDINKLLVLDKKNKILSKYKQGKFKNIIGIIGYEKHMHSDLNVPYFNINDASTIADFIVLEFEQKILKRDLFGLVLAGGQSTRMKSDKSALFYDGKTQIQRAFATLKNQSKDVFISCREDQAKQKHLINFPQIHDKFNNFGPMGGILSAMMENPSAAWFVLACDLPHFDENAAAFLIKNRNPYKMASCFFNSNKQWREPLCTIYEPKSYSRLFQFISMGTKCPRRMLMNSEVKQINPLNDFMLNNINTPKQYKNAKDIFKPKKNSVY